MSEVSIVQLLALLLCVVFAALRLPDALNGKGRRIFAVLVLFTIAVSLSVEPIYLYVDGLLGGVNVANLIVRLSLYAIVFLLGVRCAAAFRSQRARWLIEGPLGITALAIAVISTVVLFTVTEHPHSSTGLAAYAHEATIICYHHIGRLYPAYVAACLLIPTLTEARNPASRRLHRLASGLLFTGFLMVLLFALVNLVGLNLGVFSSVLAYGSIVLVTTGLTMIWMSRRRSERRPRSFLSWSLHDEH